MMQKRGSWSTVIGLIVAAFLLIPGLAPAAESGPYFNLLLRDKNGFSTRI
jgi:hypothetical protein